MTTDTQRERLSRTQAEKQLTWLHPDPEKPWNNLDYNDVSGLLEDTTIDYIALLDELAAAREALRDILPYANSYLRTPYAADEYARHKANVTRAAAYLQGGIADDD